MSRAKWKGPFVSNDLLQECCTTKGEIYTNVRKSIIVPQFVGLTINVHNGKSFSNLKLLKPCLVIGLVSFHQRENDFRLKRKKNNLIYISYGTKNKFDNF